MNPVQYGARFGTPIYDHIQNVEVGVQEVDIPAQLRAAGAPKVHAVELQPQGGDVRISFARPGSGPAVTPTKGRIIKDGETVRIDGPAANRFRVVAAAKVDDPAPTFAKEIAADEPVGWWEFTDLVSDPNKGSGAFGPISFTSDGETPLPYATLVDGEAVRLEWDSESTPDTYMQPVAHPWTEEHPEVFSIELVADFVSPQYGVTLLGWIDPEFTEGFGLLLTDDNGDVALEVYDVAGTPQQHKDVAVFAPGKHHIVVVFDTSAEQLTVYVDGVQTYQDTMNFGSLSEYGFTLGMDFDYAAQENPGLTFETLAMYDVGLDAERVAAHFDALDRGGEGEGETPVVTVHVVPYGD